MKNSILLQEVKVGEEFILLNKNGLQKTNSTYVMVYVQSNKLLVDYERFDKSKFYGSMSTRHNQHVVLV
jgi:hypothetical protein